MDTLLQTLATIVDEKGKTKPKGFFRMMYETITSRTKKVSIDVVRRGRAIAKPVATIGGRNYNRQGGFSNIEHMPVTYNEAFPINEEIMWNRQPGVNPFSDQRMTSRMIDAITDSLQESRYEAERAMEKQAIDAILTGRFNSDLPGEEEVNFNQLASHQLVASTAWTDASSDPIANIIAACEQVKKNGKVQPTMMIAGKDAVEALYTHSDIKAQLDQRHNRTISLTYERNEQTGAIYKGALVAGPYNLEVYSYDEFYDDDAGVPQPFLPGDKVIILPNAPQFHMLHGGIPMLMPLENGAEQFRQLGVNRMLVAEEGTFIPKIYTDNEETSLHVSMCTRVLAVPTMIDQVAVIDINR